MNNLKSYYNKNEIEKYVDPMKRAEDLTIEEFIVLIKGLEND